jgi:hypothetical protein
MQMTQTHTSKRQYIPATYTICTHPNLPLLPILDQRSNTRQIDYIFGCHYIQEAMARSGTLAYIEGPQSDHRGLFVDLHLPKLQGYLTVPPLSCPNPPYLYTGNPACPSRLIHIKNQTVLCGPPNTRAFRGPAHSATWNTTSRNTRATYKLGQGSR